MSWNTVRANTLSIGPVQGDLFLPGDDATKANMIGNDMTNRQAIEPAGFFGSFLRGSHAGNTAPLFFTCARAHKSGLIISSVQK